MRVKDAIGRWGEQIAADHLSAAGLTIVERNWRCREGELDIVAREGREMVFVEVKTRSSSAFGEPSEAVNATKMARIRVVSLRWLAAHRGEHDFSAGLRFDVVSVVRTQQAGGRCTVDHVRSAF